MSYKYFLVVLEYLTLSLNFEGKSKEEILLAFFLKYQSCLKVTYLACFNVWKQIKMQALYNVCKIYYDNGEVKPTGWIWIRIIIKWREKLTEQTFWNSDHGVYDFSVKVILYKIHVLCKCMTKAETIFKKYIAVIMTDRHFANDFLEE